MIGKCMLLDRHGACGDIGDGAREVWNQPSLLVDPYTSRWSEGDYAGAIGYGTLGAVEIILGTKGAGSAVSGTTRATTSTTRTGGAAASAG
jgi:hypothetical protein